MEVKSIVHTVIWLAVEGMAFLWILSMLVNHVGGEIFSQALQLMAKAVCG